MNGLPSKLWVVVISTCFNLRKQFRAYTSTIGTSTLTRHIYTQTHFTHLHNTLIKRIEIINTLTGACDMKINTHTHGYISVHT